MYPKGYGLSIKLFPEGSSNTYINSNNTQCINDATSPHQPSLIVTRAFNRHLDYK